MLVASGVAMRLAPSAAALRTRGATWASASKWVSGVRSWTSPYSDAHAASSVSSSPAPLQRHQLIAAADVALTDENLREGRAGHWPSTSWRASWRRRRRRRRYRRTARPCLAAASRRARSRGRTAWCRWSTAGIGSSGSEEGHIGESAASRTRATTATLTVRAPACNRAAAQLSAVAPVVSTSSTRRIISTPHKVWPWRVECAP